MKATSSPRLSDFAPASARAKRSYPPAAPRQSLARALPLWDGIEAAERDGERRLLALLDELGGRDVLRLLKLVGA